MTYPLMLYRDGGSGLWDGRPTVSRIVSSEQEHRAARNDGWCTAAEYWSPEPTKTEAVEAAEDTQIVDQPRKRGRPRKQS